MIRTPVLRVSGLSVQFETPLGRVRAADDVSFELFENETLALMGETGCGKSVVASSIMQLLPKNAFVLGEIAFGGRNLISLGEEEMAKIRGAEIAIIFQNPSLSLNPVVTIGDQIAEMPQVHRSATRLQSMEMASGVLQLLGLGNRGLYKMYPFQFSGGMNQRVMIASSLMLSPKIIIADEPTKGLDCATAAKTVREVERMKEISGASLLLITHDPMLVERIADRVAVMYCGEILEIGGCKRIFQGPLHPYTSALLDCLPHRGLHLIPGDSPSMTDPPQGCKFHPRCPRRHAKCAYSPPMKRIEMKDSKERRLKCWLY
jgi:peptide/nickel transport system ATP-binding protein